VAVVGVGDGTTSNCMEGAVEAGAAAVAAAVATAKTPTATTSHPPSGFRKTLKAAAAAATSSKGQGVGGAATMAAREAYW